MPLLNLLKTYFRRFITGYVCQVYTNHLKIFTLFAEILTVPVELFVSSSIIILFICCWAVAKQSWGWSLFIL